MKEYIRRMWNVIVFFGIWFGIPYYLVNTYNDNRFFIFILVTWIPALGSIIYLNDE